MLSCSQAFKDIQCERVGTIVREDEVVTYGCSRQTAQRATTTSVIMSGGKLPGQTGHRTIGYNFIGRLPGVPSDQQLGGIGVAGAFMIR